MAAVSVIVPIYNVERYLARALDSLLAQSVRDWEAILVNDGSTDGCDVIVDRYATKDGRFRAINCRNGGVSAARNRGMEIATGKYVMFLDGDDFLHPQAMELCITAAERDGSDMVAFTYDRKYRVVNLVRNVMHIGDSKPKFAHYTEPEYLVTDNIFDYATESSHPGGTDGRWAVKHCQPWRCLYRRECIRNIHFIEGIIYEDFPWWSEVLLRIRRTTILNLPLYYYYPNPGSYLFSADGGVKKRSLEIAIAAAEKLYRNVDGNVRKAWTENFLVLFKRKLRGKS